MMLKKIKFDKLTSVRNFKFYYTHVGHSRWSKMMSSQSDMEVV